MDAYDSTTRVQVCGGSWGGGRVKETLVGGFNSISGVVGVLKWNKFGVWEQWKEGGYTGDYWEKWREWQVQTCEGFRGAAGNPKEAEQDTVVWKSVAPFLISYFWYVCVKLVNVSDQRNLNIRQKWQLNTKCRFWIKVFIIKGEKLAGPCLAATTVIKCLGHLAMSLLLCCGWILAHLCRIVEIQPHWGGTLL